MMTMITSFPLTPNKTENSAWAILISFSVDSDLGGHDYLGLVLTDQEYARVAPKHPFISPAFFGTLDIHRGTDSIDAINIREVHKQNMIAYRECKEVECALIKHITIALKLKYIGFLKNQETN